MVRSFIEAAAQACALERRLVHSLVTAAGEAAMNIIRHAHRKLPDAPLRLRFEVFADSLVMSFDDQGDPFDVARVPHLDPAEPRIGGRGVFLMRALMDEVVCEPRNPYQRGNTLRLVKRHVT